MCPKNYESISRNFIGHFVGNLSNFEPTTPSAFRMPQSAFGRVFVLVLQIRTVRLFFRAPQNRGCS